MTAPAGTASIEDRPVQFVRLPGELAVGVAVRGDFAAAALGVLALATVGLCAFPGRRRIVVGIALHRGRVVAAATGFLIGSLPAPLVLLPLEGVAWATGGGGGGGGGGPIPTPVTPPPSFIHYHLDHQGSAQVITDASGAIAQQIRYSAYGEYQAHLDAAGAWTSHSYRREFTGYEPAESTGGLFYAGARFYDPALGMFLTHDPSRQFASPYTYGNGDPVNGTDPTGADWWAIGVIVAAIIGFTSSSIQAAVNGASATESLKAGAIGGAIGAATAAVLGPLIGPGGWAARIDPAVGATFSAASIGAGVYGTYQSINTGQYVAGGVSAVLVALGAYGLLSQSGSPDSPSQLDQLEMNARNYDQRFSTPLQRAANYAARMITGDALELFGGVIGPLYGVAKGAYGIGRGLLTGDLDSLETGLADLGSVLMPRAGSHSGLGWPGTGAGNPGITPETGTRLNGASIWHDNFTSDSGFGSRAQFGWIRRAWTGPGVEPGLFGQAYRVFGTVGFGLVGAGQAALGF